MKIRLEFTRPGPGTSKLAWEWVIRMCRKLPTFQEQVEADGMRVYSLDFTEKTMASFLAIYERVQYWKNIATFVNGDLVSRGECWKRIGELTRERRAGLRQVRQLLDELGQPRQDKPNLGF